MPKLKEKIEEYVSLSLEEYKPSKVRGTKIVHDAILGSNLFYPYEIAILDLPILQRLRRISQVDVVSLVFPSGNHNRFEHTLGVTVIADKLINALFNKIEKGTDEIYKEVLHERDYYLRHARMAAIMHDCGHGPFSHMSEEVFGLLPEVKYELQNNPVLGGAKPHEMLSYMIVTSTAFKNFFEENIAKVYALEFDLDLVGKIIVGFSDINELTFLKDSINGAFDADKLDYIQRDSHFTGIKLVLDLPRLFYTIDLIKDEKQKLRLSVDLSGVAPLEQIVFSKMMLLSSIYHHHKVRAGECLFKSIFEEIEEKKCEINGKDFTSAADFLSLSDDDIYGLSKNSVVSPRIKSLASDLCNRNLPKRALVIAKKSLEEPEKIAEIMRWAEDGSRQTIALLKEAISEATKEYGELVPVCDIWIDIPKSPKFKEGTDWPIKSIGDAGGFVRLRDVFPVDDWVRAFSQNKWRGYVFTKPEYREVVHEATVYVMGEYGIKFNHFSKSMCKMEEDS